MSLDLAFLRARLDDDEAVALAADVKQGDPDWWVSEVKGTGGMYFTVRSRRDNRPIARLERLDGDGDVPAGILDAAAVGVHIARHDPARVLREVEAKRQIAGLHFDRSGYCNCCGGDYPCLTVKLLAMLYADHPDYREEWKP